MALVKNNPYPEIADYFGQYLNWKKVVLPSGEVVYELPGHPERVFVPSLSNASGRVVLRPNPKMDIEKQQAEEARIKKEQEQQDFARSPVGQILPVAAGTAGTIGSAYAINSLAPAAATGALGAGTAGTAAGAGAAGATGAGAAGATGVGAAGATGTAATGTAAAGAGSAATGAGAAGSGAAAGGSGIGLLGGLGIGAAAASALYNTYNAYENGSGEGAAGGAKKGYSKAPIWGKFSVLPLIGGAIGGVLGQKSTRDIARGHTSDLLSQGQDNPVYQAYVQGMREQYNSAPPDPSKPFHGGQYGSWDEYQKAGLDASDLTGVYGNIKTYGPQWANLTEDQRRAVTQANIQSGIYTSKKGEVEITDQQKARENYDNVMKGFDVGVKTAAPISDVNAVVNAASGIGARPANPSLASAAAAGALGRSSTRSPGIGLDGRRKVLY